MLLDIGAPQDNVLTLRAWSELHQLAINSYEKLQTTNPFTSVGLI